jgi:hypothetical protein
MFGPINIFLHIYLFVGDHEYEYFKRIALPKYGEYFEEQNDFDRILYYNVLYEFCQTIHELQLWDIAAVRDYWKSRSVFIIEDCS